MIEIDNIQQLEDYIRERGCCRIGLDGVNGVGKTTIAKELALKLGFKHFNLDDYLKKNQGRFLEFLNYQNIKNDIGVEDRVIVDGVCLLSVLSEIEFPVDIHIYVKRIEHGIWADERECVITIDIEEYIYNVEKGDRFIF